MREEESNVLRRSKNVVSRVVEADRELDYPKSHEHHQQEVDWHLVKQGHEFPALNLAARLLLKIVVVFKTNDFFGARKVAILKMSYWQSRVSKHAHEVGDVRQKLPELFEIDSNDDCICHYEKYWK